MKTKFYTFIRLRRKLPAFTWMNTKMVLLRLMSLNGQAKKISADNPPKPKAEAIWRRRVHLGIRGLPVGCSIIALLFLAGLSFAQEDRLTEENIPEEELPAVGTITQQHPVSQQPTQPQPAVFSPALVTKENKISLDIKGMDIVDVLKMLASRAELNIVVGKNVTGRVTLFLKDVELRDAFEIIILANDLAYEEKEGIINVMTQRDYELLHGGRYEDKKKVKIVQLKYAKAADLSRALNQIKSTIGRIVVDEGSNTLALIDTPQMIEEMERFIKTTDLPVQTRVFGLNYAQAEKIQPKLQEVITKGVGSLKIDERTNKVAVTDYPEKLDEIAKIISAFDEKTPQVLIDAQIIEINPTDDFKMGVNWDYWIKKNFRIAVPLPGGANIGIGPSAAITAVGDIKAVIDLLRTIGDTKILSSPRIVALNNQEARILVGTKEAYITSTTSQSGTGGAITSQSVNFVDVGIKLYVTPTINRDNFITMKIRPEISSAEPTTIISEDKETQIPIVTTSEAETTVMLKDGVTVIIAGLKRENRVKQVKKIPGLGDIPLLGFIFRSTTDNLQTTELVILLTPHIISGDSSFTDFSEIQPRDGAIFKMEKGEIIKEKIEKKSTDETSSLRSSTEYYKLVTERIKSRQLFSSKDGNKGSVVVLFVLNSDGTLKYEPKILSSTNQKLNPKAIESVKSASPFPSFPEELKKQEEAFKISLSYE